MTDDEALQHRSLGMRFDAYVERCLYDPENGFYRSGAGRAGGHRGDFLTSPEVGPLFATILGRALDQWWLDLGRPDPFLVYDIGTGPGTLARQLTSAPGPSQSARLVIGLDQVDAGRPVRGPEQVGAGRPVGEANEVDAALSSVGEANEVDAALSSVGEANQVDAALSSVGEANQVDALPDGEANQVDAALPDGEGDLSGAVVIANELLDNLPFRVVERVEQGWTELYVTTGADGRLSEHLVEVDASDPDVAAAVDAVAGDDLPLGARLPVLGRARDWVANVLERGAARLVVFDYGAKTTAELAHRGGWLRTYRQHQRGTDPLVEPGRWDITTDVGFDQLPPQSTLGTQADFLRTYGIEQLVAEGRSYWHANAANPDLTAMKMRSRVREAEALLNPSGLGSWLVATWRSV